MAFQLQPWQQPLPLDALARVPPALLPRLATLAHRESFHRALAAGAVRPMFAPIAMLPPLLIAAAIIVPGPRRRFARWPALAAICALTAYQILRVSVANVAFAYCLGVGAIDMCVRAWHLLVGIDAQTEAMRVVRRRRAGGSRARAGLADRDDAAGNGPVAAAAANGTLRWRKLSEERGAEVVKEHEAANRVQDTDELDRYEYVWQGFPREDSFLQRLGWALDLVYSFRGSGWNIAISSIPRPDTTNIRSGDVVDIKSVPRVTRCGFTRYLTPRAFVRGHLVRFAVTYLILDFFSNAMVRDPLLVLGTEQFSHYRGGLPYPLSVWSPLVCTLARRACGAIGVWAMLECYSSLMNLSLYLLLEMLFPSRGGVWHWASLFGSFEHVLDRGLAGGWGSFWHQTFRSSFLAPTAYLVKNGYLEKGSAATRIFTIFFAFLLSGLFHAAGSVSSVGLTKPWRPVAFFIIQILGVLLEQAITSMARKLFPAQEPPSRGRILMRRSFNLLFVLAWLLTTSGVIFDDLATAGVWLYEPVPLSFVKLFGFGTVGDERYWRWG